MPQNKIRTEDIVDSQITYAKIQNVSNNNLLLGRNTAGAGVIEELNAATAKVILSLNNVENVALSTWTGSTNLNTLGTITTGTWSGTTIATNKGGTGLSTLGSANQVLAVNAGGTALEYQTPLSGSGASGRVAYYDAPKSITGSSKFLYDDGGTGKLSIGASGAGKLNLLQTGDNYFYQEAYNSNAGVTNYWFTRKSQGTTLGERVTTINNEYLGALYFQGVNNSNVFEYGAQIFARQFGAAGTSVPTRLNFLTYSATGVNTNQFILHPDGGASFGTDSSSARIRVHGSNNTNTTWTAQFHNNSGSNNALMIRDDGNVGIGTSGTTARLVVRGSGDTSTTNALLIQNSGGTSSFIVQDSGTVIATNGVVIGNTSSFAGIFPTSTGTTNGIQIRGSLLPSNSGTDIELSNAQGDVNATSGTRVLVAINRGFNPVSGTANYRIISIAPTINQASGATGISNGIRIAPTLTSAADWRSIEWTNNTGFGIYGSGTAINYLAGNLGIGTTTPAFQLSTTGDIQVNGKRIGLGTGSSTTNTVFTNSALTNLTGLYNVIIGSDNSTNITSASNNTLIGSAAGSALTTGGSNTYIGRNAGNSNQSATVNFALGTYSLLNHTTGDGNLAIGFDAGRRLINGSGLTNSNLSIFIGNDTRPADNGNINQIIIGHGAEGLGSNTVTIGTTGTTRTWLGGSLTIGFRTAPSARLHVLGSGNSNTTWTAQFHNSTGTNNALMIRDDGRIGIGRTNPDATLHISGTTILQNPSVDYDTSTLSSELLTTGTGTGWSGSGFASGYLHATGNTAPLVSTFTPSIGVYYRVFINVSGSTAGDVSVVFGDGISRSFNNINPFGFIYGPRAINTTALTITPSSDFNGLVIASIKVISAILPQLIGYNSAGNTIYEKRTVPTNIIEGVNAGTLLTYSAFQSGYNNIIQGNQAGQYTTTGYNNIFQGPQAGNNNTIGNNNIFQGHQAGFTNTSGSFNIFQGRLAGYSNTTGTYNLFQSDVSGYNNTTGYYNVFQGYQAGYSNTSGFINMFQGVEAGFSNTNGSNNLFQGYRAGYYSTTGDYNVLQGGLAAMFTSGGDNNTLINNSVIIGYDSRPLASGQTNQVVIGYQGRGLGSNTTVIGNSNTSISFLHGKLTAGETNPKNKLETDGSFGRGSFVQVSGTSYTVQDTDVWIRITAATGTVVLTLPDPTLWKRREIMIMKISAAVTLNSASSNVYRFLANTAGTAILGTDGTYGAILVSDGVGWYVMG